MRKLQSILLIDDDPTTSYVNQKLLERLDVTDRVRVALTAPEALELLATHGEHPRADAPVLLFLDVQMPVMDGFEFLAAYQQLPLAQREAIVVIMLTNSLYALDVARMEQLPIAGFLEKPLTEEKVRHVLKTHFAWELPAC